MSIIPIFEITPLQSIGPVRLGSSRADAREALSALGFTLESSHGASDYFCDASIQTESGSDQNIWFIGVSCSDRFTATFHGKDVFSLSAADVFSLLSGADQSGPHSYTSTEYLFPNQLVTLWDADEQYDYKGQESQPVWAQVGLGNRDYAAAIAAIEGKA
ncbi:hypothetical protein [Pseudomonas kuykendallii]|uniref:hypothetical protein n=1 Tax=Pseudomonas kuykendallii TaxID=1007099 RepID=UPI0028D49B49|nr:hypothetical protein [Pseudomonas kuykendallii]